MSSCDANLIGGEPAQDLIDGLLELKVITRSDGSVRMSGVFSAALVRAMMRFEAKLLLQDADALADGIDVDRTPAQRRHDAMLELVRRLAASREPQ